MDYSQLKGMSENRTQDLPNGRIIHKGGEKEEEETALKTARLYTACYACIERQGQAAARTLVVSSTMAGKRSRSQRPERSPTSFCLSRRPKSVMTTSWVVFSSTSVFIRTDSTCWRRGDTHVDCLQTTSTWPVLTVCWHSYTHTTLFQQTNSHFQVNLGWSVAALVFLVHLFRTCAFTPDSQNFHLLLKTIPTKSFWKSPLSSSNYLNCHTTHDFIALPYPVICNVCAKCAQKLKDSHTTSQEPKHSKR